MASRSARSAWWHSTPGTARRFSARIGYFVPRCFRSAPPIRPLRPVTRRRRPATPTLPLDFAVEPEVVGHRRAPAIERVRLGPVARLPRARLGDVVEVVTVLGERAP